MRCIARIDGPNPCRFRSQPYSFVVVLLLNISKSIIKERNYVFSYPVIVECHVASWDHVESKLACLVQSLQTDKVLLVELSFLEGLDNIYFTRRKETKMAALSRNHGGLGFPSHHHKVVKLDHSFLVERLFFLNFIVDNGKVVRAVHKVGQVQGVVPVLCRCHKILDPGLVSAGREDLVHQLAKLKASCYMCTIWNPKDSLVWGAKGYQVLNRDGTPLDQTPDQETTLADTNGVVPVRHQRVG